MFGEAIGWAILFVTGIGLAISITGMTFIACLIAYHERRMKRVGAD